MINHLKVIQDFYNLLNLIRTNLFIYYFFLSYTILFFINVGAQLSHFLPLIFYFVAGTLTGPLDFVLHFDKHLLAIIEKYGRATYAILFGIIFCETGFVVTFFLPGKTTHGNIALRIFLFQWYSVRSCIRAVVVPAFIYYYKS